MFALKTEDMAVMGGAPAHKITWLQNQLLKSSFVNHFAVTMALVKPVVLSSGKCNPGKHVLTNDFRRFIYEKPLSLEVTSKSIRHLRVRLNKMAEPNLYCHKYLLSALHQLKLANLYAHLGKATAKPPNSNLGLSSRAHRA